MERLTGEAWCRFSPSPRDPNWSDRRREGYVSILCNEETPFWEGINFTSRPNFETAFPRQFSGQRYEGGEAGGAATLIRSVLMLNF
jgi:hypothetical protein